MAEITDAVQTLVIPRRGGGVQSYGLDSEMSRMTFPCDRCGTAQALVLARAPAVLWLMCSGCKGGYVWRGGVFFPQSRPLRMPAGLPDADARIWEEARACLGVGANAAAVMLCRKLLLHIAVAHGLPAKDDKDRAPGFFDAVEHLQREGVITAVMREWVNRIKDVGNEANHELEPIDPAKAIDVATFTQQLLVLAYEMKAMMTAEGGALD